MRKGKSFFRQDDMYLRDLILLLFSLSIGTYKIFFQDTSRIYSVIFGVFLYLAAIVIIRDFMLRFKAFYQKEANQ
ncbi:uncharacterized SAM-binding protein YcdF (DUF218 family) [Sporosarcina luteola]|nr:uncharacterized SAM-binding protein YcdF (DUF218 family) [Sporosarcina luteola]